MFNWNDLHSFITLSRCSKLILASKKLRIEPTTIARRISRLEKNLKTDLFFKSPNGYSLTEMGHCLLKHVEKIESGILGINEEFLRVNPNITGNVSISVGEGLGVEIFTKYFNNFFLEYPEIQIELLADSRYRSLANRETDISISLSKPKKGRLISWKLCDYFVKLYGSKSYLKSNSKIIHLKDLKKHRFISYVDELIELPELNYFDEINDNLNVVFRSNSLRSQYLAIKNGLGLGLIHSFIASKDASLELVLSDSINIKRGYWINIHENSYQFKRIKAVTKFLVDIMKKEKISFPE
tara:strand:+ start:1756 stop:2646 length:891 start_codon:yes stop_codon:yes gene_type:complete